MPQRPPTVRRRLPAHPSSVATARRVVRGFVADQVGQRAAETAELLVSELVTNAVVHAGTPVDLIVGTGASGEVTVSVSDGSQQSPARRHYADGAATGRGLRLVEALSSGWGITSAPAGKTVWFRLKLGEPGIQTEPELVAAGGWEPAAGTTRVELVNLPPDLYARWQEQAEALLREYLLATLEGDGGRQLMRHAECSEAIGLLSEAVDAASAPSTDSAAPRPVAMAVPKEAVAYFGTLDDTLDEAVRVARRTLLLTERTDPAVRQLSRWLCRQVQDQARGSAPQPWSWPPR